MPHNLSFVGTYLDYENGGETSEIITCQIDSLSSKESVKSYNMGALNIRLHPEKFSQHLLSQSSRQCKIRNSLTNLAAETGHYWSYHILCDIDKRCDRVLKLDQTWGYRETYLASGFTSLCNTTPAQKSIYNISQWETDETWLINSCHQAYVKGNLFITQEM